MIGFKYKTIASKNNTRGKMVQNQPHCYRISVKMDKFFFYKTKKSCHRLQISFLIIRQQSCRINQRWIKIFSDIEIGAKGNILKLAHIIFFFLTIHDEIENMLTQYTKRESASCQ